MPRCPLTSKRLGEEPGRLYHFSSSYPNAVTTVPILSLGNLPPSLVSLVWGYSTLPFVLSFLYLQVALGFIIHPMLFLHLFSYLPFLLDTLSLIETSIGLTRTRFYSIYFHMYCMILLVRLPCLFIYSQSCLRPRMILPLCLFSFVNSTQKFKLHFPGVQVTWS